VNLRPETDLEAEDVTFDRPRVLRMLARIIADLAELASYRPISARCRCQSSIRSPIRRRSNSATLAIVWTMNRCPPRHHLRRSHSSPCPTT
jgi:hypothetical protein